MEALNLQLDGVKETAMRPQISQDVLHAARVAAASAPDARDDRVRLAIAHMHAGCPDSQTIALAMIARIRSESGK